MSVVSIDKSLCTGCGQCVHDCPARNLSLLGGVARVAGGQCIECGHCFAVCPAGAVSMAGYELAGLEKTASMSEFGPERLLLAMQSRRSVRRFTGEAVSEADLARILEAGRCCPTACNAQDVHFIVLQKRIAEAEAAAVRLFRRAGKLAALIKTLPKSVPDNFFFMGAPLAIVCASSNETDAALAAAYMELCAESLGLGGFYCGYFCAAARLSGELRDIISLPDGLKPAVTLVLGHPDVKYLRRAPRRPADITRL